MRFVPSRRSRERVLAGLGVLALVVSVLLVAAGSVPGPLRTLAGAVTDPATGAVDRVGGKRIAWGVVLLAGGYAVIRLLRGRARPAAAPEFVDDPPERTTGGASTLDDGVDVALQRATYRLDDPDGEGRALRARLHRTAVETVARTGEGSREEARRSVAAGEWTDDRTAAAFLGDDEGPDPPLRSRIRGWLRPEMAFEHRVERTIDAIHRRAEEER